LPKIFKYSGHRTIDSVKGELRSTKEVFHRSLNEISQDAIESVLELISQNSLYKGEEWQKVLKEFLKYRKEYAKAYDKNLFCWEHSVKAGPVIGRIKNHSIGTLLLDISDGVDLDEAVRKYEAIVAPSNYKRPKAIFTKKMLEEAKTTLEKLGYLDSLERRYASIDDITINNILFANRESSTKLKGDVFEEMADGLSIDPKKFQKVEEISIDKFLSDVLPNAKNVEVLLENKHSSNLVSLIAPKVKDSKTMFKWNNNFSWAYKGNITDSMKERVKSAGGKVDGVLRFSIQWNDNGDNDDDLDAHCIEPNRNEIFFSNKGKRHPSTGMLDVDIINPVSQTKDGIAVENITWENLAKMPDGVYKMFVHCFSKSGGESGFTAEIEFDGIVHSYSYNKPLVHKENIQVATVTKSKEGFTIESNLPSSTLAKTVWNLTTNKFHPVTVCMYSPNYWDKQTGIGNKHYFFMLKNCINDESPNGFFNEYLDNELIAHKRVFEALGSKMKVEDTDDQLSGIGFSSTQRNTITVKVDGATSRVLKIII
jgi:hypothetical protein